MPSSGKHRRSLPSDHLSLQIKARCADMVYEMAWKRQIEYASLDEAAQLLTEVLLMLCKIYWVQPYEILEMAKNRMETKITQEWLERIEKPHETSS